MVNRFRLIADTLLADFRHHFLGSFQNRGDGQSLFPSDVFEGVKQLFDAIGEKVVPGYIPIDRNQ